MSIYKQMKMNEMIMKLIKAMEDGEGVGRNGRQIQQIIISKNDIKIKLETKGEKE